ncbi:cyclic AMP-dependent transcription factor ATF-5-like [Acipenser oxyrinchus oxyrinchus]|uniref:Cyclic AMP-dependent transcription factor ATF-5-like n=1 Tax=Acipenser oxyrinchus oxyrinchus TaxID=40147 RepID=A0AAD8CEL3_ACIOX|nr:cyclic AMP-dependent transcription factor ATF-5-like [Acipenser oxyrinchus oxyrinchus]
MESRNAPHTLCSSAQLSSTGSKSSLGFLNRPRRNDGNASCGQSQGRRGEELVENPHLIGDGLSDWMTEKVDFSSYVPPPSSHFSPPHPDSSLHSSSPQHDLPVPSDLEVMTSLLQEELAQLEDYFLSESEKPEKCEKPLQTTGYQLPYHSYQSGQSEASPLLVTLATGELDLLSFCSGPIGRPKIPRPAPYSYNRPTSNNNNSSISSSNRRRYSSGGVGEEELAADTWRCKGNVTGSAEMAVSYSFAGQNDEVTGGGVCCLAGPLEPLLKDEEDYCFQESPGQPSGEYCPEEEGSFLDVAEPREPCCFLEGAEEPVKSLEAGEPHSCFYPGFVEHRYTDCPPAAEGVGSPSFGAVGVAGEAEESDLNPEEGATPAPKGGPKAVERRQKKKDQNKTAAHRYRRRKREELDIQEEELRGLEGKNRELKDKAESVEREIQYVKDLLIEVYKARSQRLKQGSSA